MYSVIIPTYNKAEYLRLTLASFVNQTCKNFELVVVDDGCSDCTPQVIDSYKNKIKMIHIRQSNQGRSAARNIGIREATGNFIIFNDDDLIAAPNFIEEYEKAFALYGNNHYFLGGMERVLTLWNKHKRLPLTHKNNITLRNNLGVLWESIIQEDSYSLVSEDEIMDQIDEVLPAIHLGREITEEAPPDFDLKNFLNFRFNWMFGTTANMGASKDDILAAGAFDPHFKGWGMEDTDLCYRLVRNGAKLVPLPKAVNYHQIHQKSTNNDADFQANVKYFGHKYNELDSYIFHLTVKHKHTLDLFEAERYIQRILKNGNHLPKIRSFYTIRVLVHLLAYKYLHTRRKSR